MANKKEHLYVVVGLGKTGASCARFLSQHGFTVAVTDNRESPPHAIDLMQQHPNVHQSLGKFDKELIRQANSLVMSPGISLQDPELIDSIEQGIDLFGDIELFARYAQAPIVAITGTNGKSTVTALIAEMAQAANVKVYIGGNYGIPALDLLNLPTPQYYVLELSSFQLELTHTLKSAVATILNLSPDHLDRHPDYADYIAAKQRIYNGAQQAIVNRDDDLTYPTFSLPQRYFSLGPPSADSFGLREKMDQIYLSWGQQDLLPIDALKIKGLQNCANALAALAIGQTMGLPFDAMLDALKNFPGLPHRCQWIRELNGINWYNDSKATNVGACIAALKGLGDHLKGKVVLIAGGQGKNADFNGLSQVVKQYARRVVVFGEDASQLKNALTHNAPIGQAQDLTHALHLAKGYAQPGDIVLFSPACASFDMFDNYVHRGECFIHEVRALK